jgi:hypothetical protein
LTQKPSGLRCSYGWGIDDGDSLDDFLLVRLGTGSLDIADDSRHTGLIAHSGGKVDGLLGVILGEAIKDQNGVVSDISNYSIPSSRVYLDKDIWTVSLHGPGKESKYSAPLTT